MRDTSNVPNKEFMSKMVIFQSSFDMFDNVQAQPKVDPPVNQKKSEIKLPTLLQRKSSQRDQVLALRNSKITAPKEVKPALLIQVEPDWRQQILNQTQIENAYLD